MKISSKGALRLVLPIFAALAALLLAACGGDDGGGDDLDLGPSPATVVPADAPLYLEAVVRPEGEQRDELLSALTKLTGNDDPAALIQSELSESLSEEGISYEEDVAPWLGQRAGLFFSDFSEDGVGAAAIAVTDEDAARAAVDKAAEADEARERDATYEGVDYQVDSDGNSVGFVGEFLVAGTEKGFQAAVDASNGEALADDSTATEALDGAPEDSLFRSLFELDRILDLLVESGELSQRDLDGVADQLEELRGGPLVLSAQSSADAMSIEATGPAGEQAEEASEIVSMLPGDAWLAIGVPMVGESVGAGFQNFTESLQSSLDDAALPPGAEVPDVGAQIESATGLDLSSDLAWAGDLGLYAAGTSPLGIGGGLVIQTDDEAAATEAIDKLRKRLQREPAVNISETQDGFQISGLGGAPVGAEVAIRDGQVVVAVAGASIDDLLNPSETLEDSTSFSEASSALESLSPSFYLDFEAVTMLLEATGQTADPELQQALPVLDALQFLVAGTSTEGDRAIGRLVLGLKEPEASSGTAAALSP